MRLTVLIVAAALCTWAGGVPAQERDGLAAKARAELSTKDPGELLSRSLFLFYRNFGDSRLSDLGRAVWELDRKSYPELSWDLLEQPEFRIDFAQLWAQWARQIYRDEHQVKAIRSYVEPFLSSSNAERQASAVNFLGAIGHESDIPVLQQIALEERSGVALNAILGIEKIGGDRAESVLRDLEKKLQTPMLKKKIAELRPRR